MLSKARRFDGEKVTGETFEGFVCMKMYREEFKSLSFYEEECCEMLVFWMMKLENSWRRKILYIFIFEEKLIQKKKKLIFA